MTDRNNEPSGPPPEQPRSEPEIIPPRRDSGATNGPARLWIRIDERDGVRRVVIARPGPFSIIVALILVGLVAAVALLVLAGVVLIWIPILVATILLVLLSGAVRHHWRRLQAWWARGR